MLMEKDMKNKIYRIEDSIVKCCKEGGFKNYISLGFCCPVAGDLEKLGLRNSSMPYDWNVTSWSTIEDTIRSHFANYLVKDKLYQFKDNLHVYENCDAGVSFVHDFVDYLPLDRQFDKVKKKYERRINKFFCCIESPTLFFRYCMDFDELMTINDRYDEIIELLKIYNKNNEIIFISHNQVSLSNVSNIKNLFLIKKKNEEKQSDSPIIGSDQLYSILKNAKFDNREKNLRFYRQKYNTVSMKSKLKRKIYRLSKKIIRHKKYIYSKQI